MKSIHFTIVMVVCLSFGLSSAYAQQFQLPESENEMIGNELKLQIEETNAEPQLPSMTPRWFCAFYAVSNDINNKKTRITVANFSMQTIDAKLIFRDEYGKVIKNYDIRLDGKNTLNRVFESQDFNGGSHTGSVELQADSPAIFPSSSFITNEVRNQPDTNETVYYTVRESIQWHRLD